MTWPAIVRYRKLYIRRSRHLLLTGQAFSRIPDDGEALTDVYNAELDWLTEKKQNTWLTVPWLYSE